MCGRYTLTTRIGQDIADRFDVRDAASLEPATLGRFNVCPTEQVAVVTAEREARSLRWGLVPPWARELGKGLNPINLRAETAATKQPFAKLLPDPGHRCLVLADGWYEWLKPERKGGARVPFRYTVDDGAPFAFAGLWDERRVGGERIGSVTLFTTRANAVAAPVHDRMPVILPPSAWGEWLRPGNDDMVSLGELLVPAPSSLLTLRPVSTDVNNVRDKDPHLIDEVDPDAVDPDAADPGGEGQLPL
jgi:putative SOS response-associated peptidase YedK